MYYNRFFGNFRVKLITIGDIEAQFVIFLRRCWTVAFRVFRPMAELPQATMLAVGRAESEIYRNVGKYRQNERNGLLVYTLSGQGVFRDGAGEHRVSPGDVFICQVCDPATAYYYPSDGKEPWEFLWMNFEGGRSIEMMRELTGRFGPVYQLGTDDRYLQRLAAYQRYDGTTFEVLPYDSAQMVMDVLLNLGRTAAAQGSSDVQNTLVRQICQRIQESLEKTIRITDLADEFKVSREHLSRIFHEQVGVTLRDYIQQQKIVLACHLLKETVLSNKEIAVRLAFDSPTNFARAFRRRMSMTPRQFRAVGTIPGM